MLIPRAVDCKQYFHLISTIKTGWAERFDELDFLGGNGELFKGAALREASTACELMRLTKQRHLCKCDACPAP